MQIDRVLKQQVLIAVSCDITSHHHMCLSLFTYQDSGLVSFPKVLSLSTSYIRLKT